MAALPPGSTTLAGPPTGTVAVSTPAGAPDPLSYRIAVADFGRPARVYYFGDRTIMIWNKNLLADLGAPLTQ